MRHPGLSSSSTKARGVSFLGCAQVANSFYSEIFGVPAPAVGVLLYLALLLLGLARIRFDHRWVPATYWLYGLVVAATVFMAYRMALELFVLRAISLWDLAPTFITLVLLFLLIPEVWMRQSPSGSKSVARQSLGTAHERGR